MPCKISEEYRSTSYTMKEAWNLLWYWILRAIYLPAIQDHFHHQMVLHLKEYPSYFLPPLHPNFWKLGELQYNRLAELYSWGNKKIQPFVSLQWFFQVIKCILLVKAWTMLLLLIFGFLYSQQSIKSTQKCGTNCTRLFYKRRNYRANQTFEILAMLIFYTFLGHFIIKCWHFGKIYQHTKLQASIIGIHV